MKKLINLGSLFLFLMCSGIVFSQAKGYAKKVVDSTETENSAIHKKNEELNGYAVAPFGDTLFFIHNKIGSFRAKDRANTITERIKSLYNDSFFSSDSLAVSKSDIGYDIIYKGDFVIMAISPLDSKSVGKEILQLANENRAIINKSIIFQKENNSEIIWSKRIGLALLLITIIVLLILVINLLFRWLKKYLIAKNEAYFGGFKFKESYILTKEKQLEFTLRVVSIIRIIVVVFTLYFSLPILFSVFPSTKEYASTLLNWIFAPAKLALMGVVHFLPNLFSIIVIVLLFRYAIKALKYFVDEIKNGQIQIDGFYSDWAKPTFNIVKLLMYAFMLVIIFPYLPGSDSAIFQGVSVFIGILFSLGSSNAIANIVAGLVITYMRPFKVGDFIKIGDISGTVLEKTALVTRVRTTKFEDITIPNATVLSSSSINYSVNIATEADGLLIHSTVTIGYDVPWVAVQKALIEAALRTEFVEKTPLPFVLQTSLDDFYVSYEINIYTKNPNKQPAIYSSLHQNIQDCFNEAGLEIMSPHYNALRDGNKTTTPESYLDKDYKTPPFTVNSYT